MWKERRHKVKICKAHLLLQRIYVLCARGSKAGHCIRLYMGQWFAGLEASVEIERKNRVEELTVIIKEKIINKIQFVETESDVLEVLENMKYLYTIPPFVLEHFNISIKWWFQYLYIDVKNGIVYDFKLNRPLEKWIVSLTWVN